MPRLFLSAFLAVGAVFQPVFAEESLAYCSISSHQFRHAPTALSRCVIAQSKDDIDIRLSDGSHLVFPSDEQGISHMRLVTPDGLALTIINDRTVNVLWLSGRRQMTSNMSCRHGCLRQTSLLSLHHL